MYLERFSNTLMLCFVRHISTPLSSFSTWRWGMVHAVEIKWHPGCIIHTTVYISASPVCMFRRTLSHLHLTDEAKWVAWLEWFSLFFIRSWKKGCSHIKYATGYISLAVLCRRHKPTLPKKHPNIHFVIFFVCNYMN